MWHAALLIAFLGHLASTEVAQQPSSLAIDIIQKTREVYLQCSTYRDVGKVTTIFFENGRQRTDEKPFQTAFVRPGQFRFEYQTKVPPGRYIIWRDGADMQTWWNVHDPPLRTPQSFSLAIAGAMGVSGVSAYRIPSLLLPSDVGGTGVARLTTMKPIEDGTIDDRSFYRFQSPPQQALQATSVETVWIDKKTFLIRRVFVESQFPNFRTEATTDYDASINVPIPPELLAFAHP